VTSNRAGGTETTPRFRFRIRYAFEVGGGTAVLACWALYDASRPGEDLKLPDGKTTVAAYGDAGACTVRTFRTDETKAGYHWRWSLVVPGGGTTVRPATVMIVNTPNSGFHLSLPMLTFPREELARLVREAQEVTLPAGRAPMTLEEIERAGR
jgi:hypothetical protein